MRVADYIMERLAGTGLRHLFMVTGRGILYLTDAAARQAHITCISVHHEQAGAYAAMAYAQYNETLGACLVSTGCAGTNAVTGVLCAWQDEVPCLFVSGQNSLRETVRHTKIPVRTFGQQEADIVAIVSPITKYAAMIEDPTQIAYEMDKALHLAQSGRQGPVWIDVPLDIQNMQVEPDELARFEQGKEVSEAAWSDVALVHEALKAASRPVVLIGAGVRRAGAVEELNRLAETCRLPVVCASSAVDIYRSDRHLALGVVGALAASRAANFAVQNADFVLVVGHRLTTMTVGHRPEKFARAAKIAIVDIDAAEPKKGTVKADMIIQADALDFLAKLNACEVLETKAPWLAKCRHWRDIFPKCDEERKTTEAVDLYHLADRLGGHLRDDAVLVCDAGLEELIVPTTVSFKASQRCLHPVSQGAMGYALPAAVGAWLSGGKQTVAVIGDGSIMMNLQELQTVAHHRFPVKILVVNNNGYAVIRNRQRDLFRTRTIGTDASNGLSCPDFSKVAHAFGLRYERIGGTAELDDGLAKVLNAEEPVICEIMALEKQSYLHSSFVRDKTGKLAQRPLEDQAPFLERELFLSEMIIEPIDQ